MLYTTAWYNNHQKAKDVSSLGILKAMTGAIGGAAADLWKEAFICDEMDSEVLMQRARKLVSQRSSNQGDADIITDGSIIVVAAGQCAIVTENGKVVGVYPEPGEQIFCSEQSRGMFTGGMKAFIRDVGRRIAFGGDAPYRHRLYYINTKEISGNSFSVEAVPFRFRHPNADLDMDGGISCSGSYSFRIADPEAFYVAVTRMEAGKLRSSLIVQMNSELLTAMLSALARLCEAGVRPSAMTAYTEQLCEMLCSVLNEKWRTARGIEVFSMAIGSMRVLDSDAFKTLQRDTAFRNPAMAAGHLTGTTAGAMQTAAGNPSGGSLTATLITAIRGKPGTPAQPDGWRCACGAENQGRFCEACGTPRP